MTKERIKSIDLARVLAIFMVLICHCTDTFYKLNVDFMSTITLGSKVFACSAMSIGRMGVPLFLMITGFLLLERSYNNEKTLRFWNRNSKHLILCTLIWAVLIELFLILIMHNKISPIDFITRVLLLKPIEMSHFWYLPMIIGMYILIPFVANALKNYELNVIMKPIIFFSVLAFFIPFLISILEYYGISNLSSEISLGFSGGIYGIYMVMGYLIKKDYFKRFKSSLLTIIFIITFISFIILEIYSFDKGFEIHIYYESPFILICSICIFELITRIKTIPFYNMIKSLAIYSFGIYLIHNFFRFPLIEFFKALSISNPIKAVILWFTLLILSYISAIIISKIPKVGKYILYLK